MTGRLRKMVVCCLAVLLMVMAGPASAQAGKITVWMVDDDTDVIIGYIYVFLEPGTHTVDAPGGLKGYVLRSASQQMVYVPASGAPQEPVVFRYAKSQGSAQWVPSASRVLDSLPVLQAQGAFRITCPGSLEVKNGPSSDSGTSGSGQAGAYVVNNELVTAYGREGNFALIGYSVPGTGGTRFGYVPLVNLVSGYRLSEVQWGYLPIMISEEAAVQNGFSGWGQWADSSSGGVTADRQNAFALGKMTDANGNVWIYFEAQGGSGERNSTNRVRGFVLERYVTPQEGYTGAG